MIDKKESCLENQTVKDDKLDWCANQISKLVNCGIMKKINVRCKHLKCEMYDALVRLLIYLHTFVATFCRRRFVKTEKQNPQTLLLLECMVFDESKHVVLT